ncbi:MAG: hypothetical protein H6570_21115 [Lewinellaceae bacterium]|nr:hypothetical protein [Lewinellaceae bacterium]
MRLFPFLFVVISIFFSACQQPAEDPSTVVIDEAIAAQGGDQIEHSTIDFDFRNRHYRSIRDGGNYQYERIFTIDTIGQVRDVLTNAGLIRYIDDAVMPLSHKDSAAYSNSVNSVIYFALLPYYLRDPAVKTAYLDSVSIHGQPYDKIKVTFGQDKGGKDFEDEFVYWFHRKSHTMDYFAYNYQTDGGGARFRQAFNQRTIAGIRFSDYYNFEPLNGTLNIENFDRLFEQDSMKLLSEINTENIEVDN